MRKRTAVLTYELCVVLNKIDQNGADQAKKKKKKTERKTSNKRWMRLWSSFVASLPNI